MDHATGTVRSRVGIMNDADIAKPFATLLFVHSDMAFAAPPRSVHYRTCEGSSAHRLESCFDINLVVDLTDRNCEEIPDNPKRSLTKVSPINFIKVPSDPQTP